MLPQTLRKKSGITWKDTEIRLEYPLPRRTSYMLGDRLRGQLSGVVRAPRRPVCRRATLGVQDIFRTIRTCEIAFPIHSLPKTVQNCVSEATTMWARSTRVQQATGDSRDGNRGVID